MNPKVTKAKRTHCDDCDRVTVRELRAWLAKLPKEFQDAPFYACIGSGIPFTLKRVVAYRYPDGEVGVVANPMGSHLPFDESMAWEHVLQ